MAKGFGNATDFDGWADEGAPGWSYREMLPYFIRSEGNERGDSRYHGHSGPLTVRDGRSMHPLVDHLIEAAVGSGYRLNDDFNGPLQMGHMQQKRTMNGMNPVLWISLFVIAPDILIMGEHRAHSIIATDTFVKMGGEWKQVASHGSETK